MKGIELTGAVDPEHRLRAEVPASIPVGPVRLVILLSDEDEAGTAWAQGISWEWRQELGDPREDMYTLQDGEPVDAAR